MCGLYDTPDRYDSDSRIEQVPQTLPCFSQGTNTDRPMWDGTSGGGGDGVQPNTDNRIHWTISQPRARPRTVSGDESRKRARGGR